MFLRKEPISEDDKLKFAQLINHGVNLEIVIFEDQNGSFEYPVYLATYNGRVCHFHHLNNDWNYIQQTINEVWDYLNS